MLAFAVVSWTRNDDAAHTAKVGIGDFEIQDLPRKARDHGVPRAEIDPRTGIRNRRRHVWSRKERRILIRERGNDGAGQRRVCPLGFGEL